MPMTFDQWRQQSLAQGGLGRRIDYDAHLARLAGATGFSNDVTGQRDHARGSGQSEDFGRFDEGSMQAWEKYRDPNCPPNFAYQAIDGSGCVEKPIDSNSGAIHGGKYDAQGNFIPGSGGGGGGGGGRPRPGAQPTRPGGQSGLYNPNDPLQNQLVNLFQEQGGMFGQGGQTEGAALKGGGLWWAPDSEQYNMGGLKAANPLAPKKARRPVGIGGQQNPFQQTANNLGVLGSAQSKPAGLPGSNMLDLSLNSDQPLEAAMMRKFRRPEMTFTGNKR